MPELRNRFKFFIKKNGCPRCVPTKQVITDLSAKGEDVEVYYLDDDLVTPDGLAEASYYSVMGTPTIVVVKDTSNGTTSDEVMARATGEVDQNVLNKVLEELREK